MKKIITACLISLFTLTANAKETIVNVYWPFAAGSQQANMIRNLIESANSSQNKYQFVFVHKPGAGGSIAANSSLTDKNVSVLASTSSFYIRPMLYKQSHDIEKFNLINTVCVGQPLAIFSKNKNLLKDAENKEVTLGVIPGSITTLLVRSLRQQNPNLKIIEVPFKSTPDATLQMLGGHISGSIDFIGKLTLSTFNNSVHTIGLSGTENIPGFKTFNSQGIKGTSTIVNDYYIFVPVHTDSTIVNELHSIFNNAINQPIKSLCEDDFGHLKSVSLKEAEDMNLQNVRKWKDLTKNIIKE